jgi:NAD(P)-dependent dehydrogenase (short-subunit alcohol dehydrogenase family)
MDLGLRDKVALVTGGSRGIGRLTALRLAEEGCHVALCARNPEGLARTADELRAFGGRVHGVAADVTAPGEVERFAAFEQREFPWGRLGTAEEIADVVTFVLSPRASWINGANIPVDGAQGRPSAF